MTAAVSGLLVFGRPRGPDKESWGPAVFWSVAAHVGILALFFISSPVKVPLPETILTEVNFVERPEEPAPAPAPEPAGGGQPDVVAMAPDANPQNTIAFAGPPAPPRAQAVSAPIIAAPIAPAGAEVGAIGVRRAALAPLPAHADATTAKRGPVPLPMAGVVPKGGPIALNTQGVDDVRRRGGGPVIPLLTQGGGGSGGGPVGKAMAGGSGIMPSRKVPLETLKTSPIDKEAWGKKNSPFSLEGPLKYRKIKAMQMPPYPRWAEEQGVESSVSYRIWVDPKGKVKDNMYLEKTSGYTELDGLAKEALLKFVFVPLPDGAAAEDEWGVATFRFELKK